MTFLAETVIELVFLDRDGVLNETLAHDGNRGPRNLSELRVFPEVTGLGDFLASQKIGLCIVTNQPDLGRGKMTWEAEREIEAEILSHLPPETRYLRCPHDNNDQCTCRKPQPGMVNDVLTRLAISKTSALMVGDRWTDILCAKRAGITSVLLTREWSWHPSSQGVPPRDLVANYTITDLLELKEIVLSSNDE